MFNKTSRYQLGLEESLINAFYIATLESGGSKKMLVKKPCRKANDRFAIINDYDSMFDPENPTNFNYLITMLIKKGSKEIFSLLDHIFQPFGIVANQNIALEMLYHRITVVVAMQK